MTDSTGFAVRFDFPADDPEAGAVCYAGRTADGALGFAYQLETAEVWWSEITARNFLDNGYGPNMRSIGTVVRVVDGVEVDAPVAS